MIAPRVRRRLVPVVLVVLVLSLVPTLSAQALPLDLALHAQGLWWKVVDAFSQVWVRAEAHRVPVGGFTKEGAGISPLGAPTEAGSGIDPEGAPTNTGSATEPAGPYIEAGGSISPDG